MMGPPENYDAMDAQSKSEQLAGSDGPPRALLIAALLLTVVVIGIMLAIAATRHPPQQPVAIPAVPAPQADDPACRALLQALPQRLGDYQRAPAARPCRRAAAWRAAAPPSRWYCGAVSPGRQTSWWARRFRWSTECSGFRRWTPRPAAKRAAARGTRSTGRCMWRSHCRRGRGARRFRKYPR
ncbi:hypothetical protein I553_3378 [Mycobacterium xenopi 4042]|uniref:Uncharacterized protein n=1 Tax=Mycobacterium xenopi 4042 TaxID=1299334 RepID=X8DD53_MYCXE|nr:hypothetical protein I553_3378 [Mycobacterium xenopi 4042]